MDILIWIILVLIMGSVVNGFLKIGVGGLLLSSYKPAQWLAMCTAIGLFVPFLSALINLNPSVPFWSCTLVLFVRVGPGISADENGPFVLIARYFKIGMAVFVFSALASYFVSYGESCSADGECSRFISFLG